MLNFAFSLIWCSPDTRDRGGVRFTHGGALPTKGRDRGSARFTRGSARFTRGEGRKLGSHPIMTPKNHERSEYPRETDLSVEYNRKRSEHNRDPDLSSGEHTRKSRGIGTHTPYPFTTSLRSSPCAILATSRKTPAGKFPRFKIRVCSEILLTTKSALNYIIRVCYKLVVCILVPRHLWRVRHSP